MNETLERIIETIAERVFKRLINNLHSEDWLTRKQIKAKFNIGRQMIEEMENNGLMYIDGRPRLYNRNDVNRYLHDHKTNQNGSRKSDRL